MVDSLHVRVFADRAKMGLAAATFVAEAVRRLGEGRRRVRVVFAAAPSQNEFLAALVAPGQVDWSRVVAFHMDEYLGLPADHPAAFRNYLRLHLFQPAGLPKARLELIPGEQIDRPAQVCLDYEEALRDEPPQIVCGGIGENGHLAFNDPPVADFHDPVLVKVVRLDKPCRIQQVNDGCFERIDDVPTHAYTLTIPALLRPEVVSIVVPGPRKAEAVAAALREPIDESCPASILRTKPGAVLWLDRESAARVM